LVHSLPRLKLRGIMAIPRASTVESEVMQSFNQVSRLYESLRLDGFSLDTLSMGMSADLEQAILCGSTMVRIGTDLFGSRN
jgi:uncharacterized pyridoxal phosphate-containing UPF0001 family protein